jgi:alcohol-forming fatty acyl-CoA reductase
LKKSQPQVFSKLVPVEGDITLPGLGLSPVDVEILKQSVSVVFHLAARIKFDRNLKEATEINVKGVRRILELCCQLPLLEVNEFF